MFATYHQMQHFISDSPWDHRALMDQVALDVSCSLPHRKLTGLIIDEIESTFRTLKTDLDLRPIYHKRDDAAMEHLNLGLLACWVVNTMGAALI